MCSHIEIIEHIFFKYFIAGSKVISVQCNSDNATLHVALSHNALYQHSKVIVSEHYRCVQVRAINATKSERSEDMA